MDIKNMKDRFEQLRTPFYYYDTGLLSETLETIRRETAGREGYHLHYAVKACANPEVLRLIQQAGFGADCVSGGEIRTCLENGFRADTIVFAGVGKADWEIELALEAGIQCFNVESIPELEVIAGIASKMGKVADVSFRINPDVGAHTHGNITTGLAENKFGIAMKDMTHVIGIAHQLPSVRFTGLHFHIGSQILLMDDFEALCHRINELQDRLEDEGFAPVAHIAALKLRPGQQLHFELGRAVVGQCGSLVTRCLYVKQTESKQFVIVDAGMTDLIRPALYGASHCIQNLSSTGPVRTYDVVGPICESSDVFAKDYLLPETRRGDLIVLRSAGAYGETMASCYNCRELPKAYIN